MIFSSPQRFLAPLSSLCLSLSLLAGEGGRRLDGAWVAAPSDGVDLALSRSQGRSSGTALRMAFDFHGGAGYAVARLKLPLELPANYEISFWMRGQAPVNNLEFKLADPGGENVWWVNRPKVTFPGEWTRVVMKKRNLTFAWGPAGGGEAKAIGSIEVAVTAGKGGRGHLEIDGLTLRELPPPSGRTPAPIASAAASRPGRTPALAADGGTRWAGPEGAGWYQLDFQEPREFGGLVLDWDPADYAQDYDLDLSADGVSWSTARRVRGARGGRAHLALPEAEARFLRIRCLRSNRQQGWGLRQVRVQPLAFGASDNALITAMAKDAPRGDYPRAFRGEQSYWTVVGVDGGHDSGLLGEDGALEAGRGRFAVEPMLWSEGRLLRWSDVTAAQTLEQGYLPIPTVTWRQGDLTLGVTAFGSGSAQEPVLRCRYRLGNASGRTWRGRLFLALRPFQVNPPMQFLGVAGGVTAIRELALEGRQVRVNGVSALITDRTPDGFGAAGFDQGPLVDRLHRGELPGAAQVVDPMGLASGALGYDLEVPAGQSREICVDLPLGRMPAGLPGFQEDLDRTAAAWVEKLNRVAFELPDPALANTLRTCLAHMLISRQGPAIQPGTRSYARSWIRDGALIGSVLLRLGHPEEVREFLRWYAPYQFAHGKIPCVVDERGADPVPENDSHGEFIYLLAEYGRLTGDLDTVRALWPKARLAAAYIDSQLELRRGPDYQSGAKRLCYGLMPESISHEGYSAKAMHAYWDDFFTLRGLKDAAALAGMLGETAERDRFQAQADRFRGDLLASLRRTMASHGIPYLPGCAELGDFDATSTTAAIDPCGELEALPRTAVDNTFATFYQQFTARRSGPAAEDRYTPYETRVIGTLVRLGWKDKALELLDAYMADRRPVPWNQWPEVVQRELRTPVFLGDLPHTWVASDFLRSVTTLFCFEQEADRCLVLGAGLPEAWLRTPQGVAVRGLRLASGSLSFHAQARGEEVSYDLSGPLAVPEGGLQVRWPLAGAFRRATVDGVPVAVGAGASVVIHKLPARVVMGR